MPRYLPALLLPFLLLASAAGADEAVPLPEVALGEEAAEATDYLEADHGEYISGDRLELTGNVLLHTESAFPGLTVEVRAERALWSEAAGKLSVPGTTTLTLVEYALELSGEGLEADLAKRSGRLDAVRGVLRISPDLLADETGLVDSTYIRFRSDDPKLHLAGGDLQFYEDGSGVLLFEFSHATLSSTAPEHADWKLRVQRLLYAPGEFVSARNTRLEVAGLTVGYVPRFKTRLRRGRDFVSSTFPLPGLNEDDGLYFNQATFVDAGSFSADVYTRYLARNDEFWTDAFAYANLSESSRLGVHLGRDRSTDRFNERVGRTTRYDFYYQAKRRLEWPLIETCAFGANVAELKQDEPAVESRVNSAYAEVTTPAFKLDRDVRMVASFGARYYDYSWGGNEFLSLHSRVKVAKATPWGVDFVEFAHSDKSGATPFRFHDDFPQNLLRARKCFQLLPHLTGRVSADYDFDLEHFDLLTIGLSKEFTSFYLGANYNFARESAGIEVALKF